MTGQAGAGLGLDRGAGLVRVPDDQTLDLGFGRMFRSGAVAGFADRNRRIRPVGDVQTQSVQSVREMIRFELVAGDAGLLADRSGVGCLRIVRELGVRKTGRRLRQPTAVDRRG